MDWKDRISGCFGQTDRAFAVHPSDEERAFELLAILRSNHVGWKEFEAELVKYLNTTTKLHTDTQVERVKKFYRPWLLD